MNVIVMCSGDAPPIVDGFRSNIGKPRGSCSSKKINKNRLTARRFFFLLFTILRGRQRSQVAGLCPLYTFQGLFFNSGFSRRGQKSHTPVYSLLTYCIFNTFCVSIPNLLTQREWEILRREMNSHNDAT